MFEIKNLMGGGYNRKLYSLTKISQALLVLFSVFFFSFVSGCRQQELPLAELLAQQGIYDLGNYQNGTGSSHNGNVKVTIILGEGAKYDDAVFGAERVVQLEGKPGEPMKLKPDSEELFEFNSNKMHMEGHDFAGWVSSDFDTKPEDLLLNRVFPKTDTIIMAQWEKYYTVTFVLPDGHTYNGQAPQTVFTGYADQRLSLNTNTREGRQAQFKTEIGAINEDLLKINNQGKADGKKAIWTCSNPKVTFETWAADPTFSKSYGDLTFSCTWWDSVRTFTKDSNTYNFDLVTGYHFEGTEKPAGVSEFRHNGVSGDILFNNDHYVQFSNTNTGIQITQPNADFDYIEVGFKKQNSTPIALTLSSSSDSTNLISSSGATMLNFVENGLNYNGLKFWTAWKQQPVSFGNVTNVKTFTSDTYSYFGSWIDSSAANGNYLLVYDGTVVTGANDNLKSRKWKASGKTIYLAFNWGGGTNPTNNPIRIDYIAFYKKR